MTTDYDPEARDPRIETEQRRYVPSFSFTYQQRPQMVSNDPARYAGQQRQPLTKRPRQGILKRRKRATTKKTRTPAEQQTLLHRRDEEKRYSERIKELDDKVYEMAEQLHEEFPNRTSDQIYEDLLQHSQRFHDKRRVNGWNAFMSLKLEELNASRPEGTAKLKANEAAPQICEMWQALTAEEKKEITEGKVVELADQREAQETAPHKLVLGAFHDASKTLRGLVNEIATLHRRTGTQIVMMATRSRSEHFLKPFLFTTSEKIDDYFYLLTKQTPSDLLLKLEAYCLSGMIGVSNTYQAEIANLKAKCSSIIKAKFVDILLPHPAPRLNYLNFETAITDRYGVMIEGWPLRTLKAPGDVGSRVELETLLHAWQTGTAKFIKLNSETFKQYKAQQLEKRAAEAQVERHVGHIPDDAEDTGTPPIAQASAATEPRSPTSPSASSTSPVPPGLSAPQPPTPPSMPTSPPDLDISAPSAAGTLPPQGDGSVTDTSASHAAAIRQGKRPGELIFSIHNDNMAPKRQKAAPKPRSDKGKRCGPNKRTLNKAANAGASGVMFT